jgi:hypothetical protein
MAAGAITRDTGSPVAIGGGLVMLTGTIEVDNTYRAFALLPTTSYITSCTLQDQSGAGSAEVDLNVNASGTATNGTIAAAGNHTTTQTYRYACIYAGQ